MAKLNRDLIYVTIIIALVAGLAQLYYSFRVEPALELSKNSEVQVYYNKQTAGNELIIDEIRQADRFVYFAIYTFTRSDIKDALLAAKMRGLEVKGLIDKEQTDKIDSQRDIIKELQTAGIPLAFDDHSAIMHLKVLVTDKSYITGSFNWTASATESNDEVLEIGRDNSIRTQYEKLIRNLFKEYPPQ